MSDLLHIGASGVRAYQSALTTVSENIANVGTPGFTRRTTNLSEVSATSAMLGQRITVDPNGVVVSGVTRVADDLRTAAVRSSGADLARTESGITWLTGIENALSGNALGDQITAFFNAAKGVAADATASAPRALMLESAASVANAFTATGAALDQAMANLDATADSATSQLNRLAASLAQVNSGLGRSGSGTTAAAQLADQRDQILEQMSAITDVSVSTDMAGRVTVRLGNATGPVMVSGDDAGQVTYARNSDGAVSFAVLRDATSATFSPNGGALAGITEGAQRIVAARQTLNQIAGDFTAGVNAIQAQGRDLNGQPGAAIFATGATPTDISVVLSDPSGIAAAAVGGGTRDNSNLAAYDTLRRTAGSETKLTALISGNAATLSQRKTVADAQTAIHDGAVSQRDSMSGVNLDSEAVDLMRFQQAYQASSRVIQTARDIFQSILEIR